MIKIKYILFFLFINLILISYAQINSDKGSVICSHRKINTFNKSENKMLLSDNLKHSYDVLDYKIYLDIYNCFLSPYPKNFNANVIITAKADSLISFIDLNAVNTSLAIDSVSLAGSSFTHANNILRVNLNRTYSPGETLYVKIYYRHLNVSDNAVYVSNGFFFTDCEPEGARKWFPCWDKPSDKATLNLTARVPATVKLGSNGRLADSIKINDTIYYNWISRDPIATYLVVVTAKVNYNLDIIYYQNITNPNILTPIRFYYNSGENISSIKPKVLQMATLYSNLFCEHPFEKNGFATLNSQFQWGGMENQTLTSLCPNCWGESVVSHEFAHQWFGDMITCATWADIWLNEGFATYIEALWLEYTSGYSAYKSDLVSNANYYLSNNPGWAISNPSWAITTPSTNTLFNLAVTYYKGSCVLHLLRYTLGDSLFFATLKNYANDPIVKYNSAVIPDFVRVVNNTTGKNYSWFFDQWLYQPNHPVYANQYSINNLGNNYWSVGFTAKQTQTNTGFFKMPIEIKISFSTGPDTIIKVFNDMNNQTFSFIFNRQPTNVVFDPNNEIILKTATLTQTTHTVKSFPVIEGWNLISIPLTSNDMRPNTLLPTAISNCFKFDEYYSVAETLKNGSGYWVKFSASQIIPNIGSVYSGNSLNLKQGWNLIGIFDKNVELNQITTSPNGILTTPFYEYNGSYIQANTLQIGKGFWIKSNSDGTLIFNTLKNKVDNEYRNLFYIDNFEQRIIISDDKNNETKLYLVSDNINLEKYELPPLPPNGVFDVRFATNRYVDKLNTRDLEILINSANYPLNLKVENIKLILEYLENGNIINKILEPNEEIKINNPDIKIIKIKKSDEKLVYSLSQNYPNPFNPSTEIQFSIMEEALVKLKIYDALGKEIETIFNRYVKPGNYKAQFIAYNYSSGIYFYELIVNSKNRVNFREIKKMILIK